MLDGKKNAYLKKNHIPNITMKQSKTKSLIESVANVAAGFLISLLIQLLIYPLLDIEVSINQNLTITAVFTVVSIIRNYIIRRLFI
jgi:hypothetical protein